jgi:hypothetical protein
MLEAIGHILPISVAVALSSVPITAMLVILLSKNRNRSAVPFLIGWVVGLALVVSLFTLFGRALPGRTPGDLQAVVGRGEILVGIALIAVAMVSWRRAVRAPRVSDAPRWVAAVGSLGPWSCLGVALILNVRPKALLLSAAAGLSVHGDHLDPASTVIVIGIYTLISASTVAGPIIATLIAPDRMEPTLVRAEAFISKYGPIATALIMLMIGVVIVGDGLTRL